MLNVWRYSYDEETGEVITYQVNEETGESSVSNIKTPIPTLYRESVTNVPKQEKYMKFPRGHITKTKRFQSLKANILAGCNPISYRMLLIPTIMIFPALLCFMLMVLEIYLHMSCHKKNKHFQDPSMYYQSPFHVVTSVFCGVCRDCDTASKVGQLQDQRRYRHDYMRSIAL